jgi:type I restriction enzyme S subunit
MAARAAASGTGRTGGRDATTGVIPGRFALSVGMPDATPSCGWQWTQLTSVAQLESGHTPSRRHPDYWDGDVPWIGIKDATENHGRTIKDTYQHVTELGLENSSARLLPANTVCLSRTASVGFVVVMGRPMATSQDFINWVCGPNIDAHFLKYVLLAENEALWRFASGTTHQTIYYPEAKAFHICLPPVAEQKAIVHVLGKLDEKIELNRRINTTLETMARALFQSWFVDFEPVRAKLNGRVFASLDPAIVALFPSRFQDSPLGPIPQGWEVGTIEKATSLIIDHRGRTPKKMGSNWAESGIPAVSAKNVKGGRLVRPEMFNFVSEELFEKWMKDKLAIGDILMTSEAPLGELCFLALDARFCLSQRVFALRANPSHCEATFLYYWLNSASCRTEIINRGTGTTVEGIRQSELRKVAVLLPPLPIQKAAARFLAEWTEQIHRNEAQSRVLANLRDTLLPKLLSGELRVAHIAHDATNIVPFPDQASKEPAKKTTDEFVEAVVIAQLVRKLAKPNFPLGRKRYNKLAYLAHRKAEDDVSQHYLKKAAGPYSPWAKYGGPEKIAEKNGYVKQGKAGVYSGLVPGDHISKIDLYLANYPVCTAIDWVVDKFRFEKNDGLELLATVDFAALDLLREGQPITRDAIKHVIAANKEWAPKLDRAIFSDESVDRALAELAGLFPATYQK